MTAAFRNTAAVWLLALAASATAAETHKLDDSLSHTVPPTAQMQWLPQTRAGQDGGMEAWVRVNIHIDTQDWVGRSGRIYMVLPRDETSTLEAVWTTDGKLLAGRLVSGERALVYAGNITANALRDQMLVRLRSGPDWQSNSRRLNFHFEIDVDSP
jgi:hypothetical protein